MARGYNFGGKKASLIRRRAKFLADNPGAAKLLARGIKPKGYPENDMNASPGSRK